MIEKKMILQSIRNKTTTRILFPTSASFPSSRLYSLKSDTPMVRLDIPPSSEYNGTAILRMSRPPANSLSLEMFQEMSKSIKEAESDDDIQALILASDNPKIFSAGLDLSELYEPDQSRLIEFWSSFQQLYLDLYGSRLSTFAAMGGHAPAAGCMLALSCDYRLFSATGGKIGLNESLLGIVAPPWLGRQYIDTIGLRRAENALSLGSLFSPDEALKIGLVDEVVQSADVVEVALERTKDWLMIPPQARVGAKKLTRGRQIQHLIDTREADTDAFCSFVTQDEVQKSLGKYIEQMNSRKKK